MMSKDLTRAFGAFVLGLAISVAHPILSQAKDQGEIIILFKAGAETPVDKIATGRNGAFLFSGLDAGMYKVCFENGSGCAEAMVGKNGTIRGTGVVDQGGDKATRKHNYVGHVTLLR